MMLAWEKLDWQLGLPEKTSVVQKQLLMTQGSLTLALNKQCGEEISVLLLSEGIITKYSSGNEAWVREVLLLCKGCAVLYAVSEIAFTTLQEKEMFLRGNHAFADLRYLGNRPLGYWIAEQEKISRSQFSYAMSAFEPSERMKYFMNKVDNQYQLLPIRQSSLSVGEQSLVLIEMFL